MPCSGICISRENDIVRKQDPPRITPAPTNPRRCPPRPPNSGRIWENATREFEETHEVIFPCARGCVCVIVSRSAWSDPPHRINVTFTYTLTRTDGTVCVYTFSGWIDVRSRILQGVCVDPPPAPGGPLPEMPLPPQSTTEGRGGSPMPPSGRKRYLPKKRRYHRR